MLTDLIIESAIRESGEKRSSLEMSRNSWYAWQTWRSRFFVCSFVFNILLYLNAKMFIIVWIKQTTGVKKNLNIIILWPSCDYFNKNNNNIIIVIIRVIYIYIYRSVALGSVLLAEFGPWRKLIEEPCTILYFFFRFSFSFYFLVIVYFFVICISYFKMCMLFLFIFICFSFSSHIKWKWEMLPWQLK